MASPHHLLPLTLSGMHFHSNPSFYPERAARRQVPQAHPNAPLGASLCLLSPPVSWGVVTSRRDKKQTPPTQAVLLQRTFYDDRNVQIGSGPQGECGPPSAVGHLKHGSVCDRETRDVIQLHFTSFKFKWPLVATALAM